LKDVCSRRRTLRLTPLLVYLQRRARRQLGWFTDSKARLEHIAEWRNAVLPTLYCLTAFLAVLKLAFFLCGGHSPAYLLPPLLIVTGIALQPNVRCWGV